ncbi:MAG: transketolase family protein [Anaerolineales bacterium]|nr:transketolase family protein [Anaerolineales bacterium]
MSKPIAYHLVKDDQYKGLDIKKAMTREAWSLTLIELAEEHPEIVVLSADLLMATLANRFGDRYPERTFNVGVAEQDLVGIAAGLALTGKTPVIASFSVFLLMRACEQVRTDICYPNLNVKLIGTASGFSFGLGGATHATTEDLALARALPNLTVLVPADYAETAQAMRAAIAHQGPVFLRVGRSAEPVIYNECPFEIGRANQLRAGDDLTLIACGAAVFESLRAAEMLEAQGVHARVLDMHSLKPIDTQAILAAARETKAILTVEEHTIIGGLGGAVAETLAGEGAGVRLTRIGVPDIFATEGNADYLRRLYGINGEGIARQALAMLERE